MDWTARVRAVWGVVVGVLHPAVQWLVAREPAGVPRWVWALAVVAVAYVGGRIGGRLVAGALRLVLLAAALVIGWQLVHVAG
jgi:hypothetical protein